MVVLNLKILPKTITGEDNIQGQYFQIYSFKILAVNTKNVNIDVKSLIIH